MFLSNVLTSSHLRSCIHQASTQLFSSAFSGPSLQYVGGSDTANDKNYGRLSEKLNEADIERRKAQDAADQRERAAEIRREERLAKIKYMEEMPDSTPAGTGECQCAGALLVSLSEVSWSLLAFCSH